MVLAMKEIRVGGREGTEDGKGMLEGMAELVGEDNV